LAAKAAAADGGNPAPDRLIIQPPRLPAGQTCQSIAANPELAVAAGVSPNQLPCLPDNVAFRNYISDLGFAIAPNAFHPANTTGFGGFALTFDFSFSKVNSDATSTATDGTQRKFWQDATEGPRDPATKAFGPKNANPDSVLGIYSLKARKGLPMGFEVGTSIGWIGSTSLWVLGADLRWSVLEGFRTRVLGAIPDLSVGAGVRTLTGTSKFNLTTVGVDVQLSKPIPIAEQMSVTPWVGYQRLFIFGDASVLDATPNVDALNQCGYSGTDSVTGGPVCRNKLSNGFQNDGDFNNNFVFEKVRTHRHRMNIGVSYRYEFIYLATQMIFDLIPAGEENPGLVNTRQWTYSLEGGVWF
jgi:hypothetical protein